MDRHSGKVLPWSMDPFSSSLSETSLSRKLIFNPLCARETTGLRSQEGDVEEEVGM